MKLSCRRLLEEIKIERVEAQDEWKMVKGKLKCANGSNEADRKARSPRKNPIRECVKLSRDCLSVSGQEFATWPCVNPVPSLVLCK